MKPEGFLDDTGRDIFKRYKKELVKKGLDDPLYGLMLSMLSNEVSKYANSQIKAREREEGGQPGFYNYFKDTGMVQVNAFHTMGKDAANIIDKLSGKFGLTPVDFKKVQDMIKSSTGSMEDNVLEDLLGKNVSTT